MTTANYDRTARVVESGHVPLRALRPLSLRHPWAIVWTMTLFAVWLCGNIYFPLTTTADAIVLAGVLAFSVRRYLRCRGSFMARGSPCHCPGPRPASYKSTDGLTIAVRAFPLNIPFSYLYFSQISGYHRPPGKACGNKFVSPSSKANVTDRRHDSLPRVPAPALPDHHRHDRRV